jgi:hypothetical protein
MIGLGLVEFEKELNCYTLTHHKTKLAITVLKTNDYTDCFSQVAIRVGLNGAGINTGWIML